MSRLFGNIAQIGYVVPDIDADTATPHRTKHTNTS